MEISKKSMFFARVLGVLGLGTIITGCPVMYGCPFSQVNIDGKVVNANGEGIKKIQITHYGGTLATTDENGDFSLKMDLWPRPTEEEDTLNLNFHDIDAYINGDYEDAVKEITIVPADAPKDDPYKDNSWFRGYYGPSENVVVVLKEK